MSSPREQRRAYNREVDRRVAKLEIKKQAILNKNREERKAKMIKRLERLEKIEEWLKQQQETFKFAVSHSEPLRLVNDPEELIEIEEEEPNSYEFFRTVIFVKEVVMLRIRLRKQSK